jgi:hypothetical protein
MDVSCVTDSGMDEPCIVEVAQLSRAVLVGKYFESAGSWFLEHYYKSTYQLHSIEILIQVWLNKQTDNSREFPKDSLGSCTMRSFRILDENLSKDTVIRPIRWSWPCQSSQDQTSKICVLMDHCACWISHTFGQRLCVVRPNFERNGFSPFRPSSQSKKSVDLINVVRALQ